MAKSRGLAALTPNGLRSGFRAVGNFVARGAHRVDSKLVDAIKTAADRFPGYAVEAYSGFRPSSKSGTSRHTQGMAVDVRLIDLATGQVVPNYQDPAAFRVYEQFAQTVRQVQMEKYPELAEDLRWGGYFSGVPGVYGAVDLMHFDLKPGGVMAGGSWAQGLTDEQRANWPGAESIGMGNGTPNEMQAPLSLAQTQLRDEAIRTAFANPTRALDVPSAPALALARPSTPTPMAALNAYAPPSSLSPAPFGKVDRAPLGAVLPSRPISLTPARPTIAGRPEFAGNLPAAPFSPPSRPSTPTPTRFAYNDINAVRPSEVGRLPAAPTKSLAHPTSVAKPSPLAAAPVGKVERGPALAPAGPSVDKTAAAYAEMGRSKQIADEQAYAAYEAQRAKAFSAMPAPTPVAAAPRAVVDSMLNGPLGLAPGANMLTASTARNLGVPPALPPPAQVLAPVLAPPKTVRDYPVAEVQAPPAPPAATAYDVYSGLATQAKDNTGKNTVGMLPDGTTTVTNQWGVTTGMTPYGKQTAVGNLPGISGPVARNVAKMGIPAVGGLLGGLPGSLLGMLAAKALSQPGGPLSGIRNVNTIDGPIQAYRVNNSLNQFPSAPSGGIRSPTFSNLSRGEMNSISPKAASDIERGLGGLF